MKVFFKHSTISVEFGHTKFLAILYNDRYNKNHTNEKEGKTLEKSIEVYGNIEIKDELDEKINNPIQVEYYKICNNKKKSTEKPYGIGVIKTYSDELETEVEKREFNHIFSKENDANNMLELLIRNKVTPITLKDILKDIVLV